MRTEKRDTVPDGYECKKCGDNRWPNATCTHCGGSGGDVHSYDGSCYKCGASGAQWPPTCLGCTAFRKSPPPPIWPPHFLLREIKDGRVKILGDFYAPREPLLPEHEGMRAAFALYWMNLSPGETYPGYDERGLMTTVSLWGSEKAYLDPEADWPGPFCQGGVFRWEWWDRAL